MKRVLSIIIVLTLALGVACAEGIDWAALSDEEITGILQAGQAELERRAGADEPAAETDEAGAEAPAEEAAEAAGEAAEPAAQTDEADAEAPAEETADAGEAAPEETPAGEYATLEKGSKGDEVKALQQRLVDLYWLDGSVDGDYGNKTKDAVQRFQEAAGLTATGIADAETQARLFAEDAPQATMSVSCSSIVLGSYGQTSWHVNGQSFTLKGSQTRKLKTPWGTFVFNALGEYKQVD